MKQDVIEKIRKLLALANSSNEHEARLAAEKASELLLRHNLKTQDLGGDQSYDAEEFFEGSRLREHTPWVISILKKHFFVEIVSSRTAHLGRRAGAAAVIYRTTLTMVGEETNLQVGHYVFAFLDRKFPELWRAFHAQSKRSRARNYYAGLHAGLSQQLYGARRRIENDTGLVVAPDPNLPAEVERLIGKTKPTTHGGPRRRASNAFFAGLIAGRNLKIRTAVEDRGDGPVRQIEAGR